MRQQEVVPGLTGEPRIRQPRRVDAGLVAQDRADPGLVEGGIGMDPVTQLAGHQVDVLLETIGRVAVEPAAALLQVLGKVPVIERDERRDAALQQAVEQALVEIQSLGVGLALLGHHARPGDRQAVGVHPQALDQLQILLPAIVVVAGRHAAVTILDPPLGGAEVVPDGRQAAIGLGCSLDLEGRRRDAEGEVRGEKS
ncbi:hypothetical protein [Halomonas sp. CKK8]|uniref:hypothetical protein n=1 Tax=Halomonas sp. CKK8 TaxID=3036127 RepID=UPI002414D692|nr:hypothetical protein [Halomonas sp. CKK8]WFM71059.1 hypothetical protein P8934_16955 [Halomonas sp. CKK8]